MSIPYNLNIPDGPNDPSVDQPKMKENTNSIDTWTNVDHIKFASGAGNTAGYHKQVTFNNKNVAGAVTDPTSILYTNVGSASTNAEMYFRNQNAIFPISALKAAGTLIPTVGALTNSFNCTFTSFVAPTLIIQLTANSVIGNNVIVLISSANGVQQIAYSFINPNLTLTVNPGAAQSALLSFAVLQF